MKRHAETALLRWFRHPRRKPLILRGARQVGKSTLVRNFALSNHLDLVEVNLERHPRLNDIFKTNDIGKILPELEAQTGRKIQGGGVLLFLDEIQATPYALPALRYFYEEKPELPVIAAGSLFEFISAEPGFSMPVGRIEYLHLGPMSFGEFLLAMKDDSLLDLLQNYRIGALLPEMAHQRLLERQRQFLFVGGMPEGVLSYSETQSPIEVKNVHRSILQTYQDDFAKYAKAGDERRLLQRVIDMVPKIVGRKIKFSEISRDDRSSAVKAAIHLLVMSKLLTPVYHSDCSGVPLRANQDENVYKLYLLDVGLFNDLCGLDWSALMNLTERELIHEGVLAEQFTAQHLSYREGGLEPPNLHYWLRESKAHNAEVDFVISVGKKILPVEVKAGKSGSLKSLQQLVLNKRLTTACRLDLNPPAIQRVRHKLTGPLHKDLTVRYELVSLPLYMAEYLPSLFRTS